MASLLVAGVVTATAAAGASTAGASADADLDQQIDPDQAIATEPAVLTEGHVDIGPRYVDDAWTLLVHDDHAEPAVWRTTPQTVFQVSDASLTTVPDDPAYAFLPAEAGTDVHVVPQAEQPGVVWVGWNTQDPTVMESIDRGATLTLRGVEGPGDLVMFLQSGTLGEPEVLWDSRAAFPQDLWVEVNTHTHANWVFSEPGVYLVEVEVSADLVSGEPESDTQVLRFAVGDATSSDEAFAAEYTSAAPGETATPPAVAEASDDGGGGPAPVLLGAVGAAALLVVVLVIVVLRGRGARRRAQAAA
ncbi:choice-of-anchor M domain-containing protein [Jiangella mangrovi]|uniref:Putative ABC transporter-associated repeat protein n=1 Tax=Jiangella mangrovi TaxID=1524084 RepID=A0A7W9GRN7_9ACTN|nr:choice-of-anchor M domain-containing protein [Jiangella mangrovi]MBB5788809.1 putative ABC transporter-associated repeat protein [Jiangella mangrovi]